MTRETMNDVLLIELLFVAMSDVIEDIWLLVAVIFCLLICLLISMVAYFIDFIILLGLCRLRLSSLSYRCKLRRGIVNFCKLWL